MSLTSLYENVSREEFINFRGHSGKIDYSSIPKFLDLDKAAISKIADVSKASVRYDHKIPKEVQEHLDRIANICQLVAEAFNGDSEKTTFWFKEQNPLLGYVSPRDMIKLGRYKKLMQFVIDARKSAGIGGKEEE